jgi:hypothetical protein
MEKPDTSESQPGRPEPISYVEQALRGLRFDTVTITVHDGAVVQVERTEKQRVPPPR